MGKKRSSGHQNSSYGGKMTASSLSNAVKGPSRVGAYPAGPSKGGSNASGRSKAKGTGGFAQGGERGTGEISAGHKRVRGGKNRISGSTGAMRG